MSKQLYIFIMFFSGNKIDLTVYKDKYGQITKILAHLKWYQLSIFAEFLKEIKESLNIEYSYMCEDSSINYYYKSIDIPVMSVVKSMGEDVDEFVDYLGYATKLIFDEEPEDEEEDHDHDEDSI